MNTEQDSIYTITISGHLKDGWKAWFNGRVEDIQPNLAEAGQTILTVRVPDQAALRGLLNKIWDLNLTVISVMIGKERDRRY